MGWGKSSKEGDEEEEEDGDVELNDVTGGNEIEVHYWSGRHRWSVGHSCFLGMPWPWINRNTVTSVRIHELQKMPR